MNRLQRECLQSSAVPVGERWWSCRGLRDICLALTMGERVVGNDVAADGKALIIVTGANQGGKSTFLRSLGLAPLLMQCSLFIAADAFCSSLCYRLFTHSGHGGGRADLAEKESILLEPVYSGKTMAGLIDLIGQGRFGKDENVVFLHTDGAVGLFGYPDAFGASAD